MPYKRRLIIHARWPRASRFLPILRKILPFHLIVSIPFGSPLPPFQFLNAADRLVFPTRAALDACLQVFPQFRVKSHVIAPPVKPAPASENKTAKGRFAVLGSNADLDAAFKAVGVADRVEQRPLDADFLIDATGQSPQTALAVMASARPVVSVSKTAAAEFVHDGINGLLCPSNSPEFLASAAKRLLEDRALRQRLGAEAQKTADEFSPEAVAEKYAELYRNL